MYVRIRWKTCVTSQAQARQEPGLQAGEGWFDVCSEGSRPAGPRSSPDQRHSEFSARFGEAMSSAIAQALCFLCAVSPQASTPDIAAMRAASQRSTCAHTAKTSTPFCPHGANHCLGFAGVQLVIPVTLWRTNIGQFSDCDVFSSVAWEDRLVSRWMRRRWQQGWGQGGPAQGCLPTCSSTASPCPMRPANTAVRVRIAQAASQHPVPRIKGWP